jgi:kynurenine formamidase
MSGGFRSIVDLTHTYSPKLPVFPAFKPVQIKPKFSLAKDGFFANEITFDEHTGTHMDAPVHFVANATTVDRLPVDRLIAPLAVVSIATRAAKDPDTALTVDDITGWEKATRSCSPRCDRGRAHGMGRAHRDARSLSQQGQGRHDARTGIQRAGGGVSRPRA